MVIGELPADIAESWVSGHPGTQVYSRSAKGTVRIWSDATGDSLQKLLAEFPEEVRRRTESGRGTCQYLGGKRHCCASLHLCRKFPGENCSPTGTVSGVHNCQTCELWEPESKSQ